MACNGSCVVQIQNIQLVAQDKAVFALADNDARWDLTAKSGRIDFAFRSNAKLVSFRTPHDVIQTERIVVSAASEGMVRGYLNVTADKTELTVEQGALQVSTRNGTQTIEPGQVDRIGPGPGSSPRNRQEKGRCGSACGWGRWRWAQHCGMGRHRCRGSRYCGRGRGPLQLRAGAIRSALSDDTLPLIFSH